MTGRPCGLRRESIGLSVVDVMRLSFMPGGFQMLDACEFSLLLPDVMLPKGGDVVGIGVDNVGEVFVTRNGRRLEIPFFSRLIAAHEIAGSVPMWSHKKTTLVFSDEESDDDEEEQEGEDEGVGVVGGMLKKKSSSSSSPSSSVVVIEEPLVVAPEKHLFDLKSAIRGPHNTPWIAPSDDDMAKKNAAVSAFRSVPLDVWSVILCEYVLLPEGMTMETLIATRHLMLVCRAFCKSIRQNNDFWRAQYTMRYDRGNTHFSRALALSIAKAKAEKKEEEETTKTEEGSVWYHLFVRRASLKCRFDEPVIETCHLQRCPMVWKQGNDFESFCATCKECDALVETAETVGQVETVLKQNPTAKVAISGQRLAYGRPKVICFD